MATLPPKKGDSLRIHLFHLQDRKEDQSNLQQEMNNFPAEYFWSMAYAQLLNVRVDALVAEIQRMQDPNEFIAESQGWHEDHPGMTHEEYLDCLEYQLDELRMERDEILDLHAGLDQQGQPVAG